METKLSLEATLNILKRHYPQIIEDLRAANPGGKISGDDVVELFAMGAATVIADDDVLAAPGQVRKASERLAKRILDHVRIFRHLSASSGGTTIFQVLHSDVEFATTTDEEEARRTSWITSASDKDLVKAYEGFEGEADDPWSVALAAEVERRGLDI